MYRIAADVCVIGGGPAGTATAGQLADLGYNVCILEREPSPSRRTGASLPSSILPLLETIGVRDRVENAGFLRPERIIVSWSESRPTIRSLPGPGFHVDRSLFDEILLQNAQGKGVHVFRPAQALRPQALSGGGWQIRLHHAGTSKELIASLIVDATGHRNVLPSRRIRVSPALICLFAHWQGADNKKAEGRIEAAENEWLWYAPLGRGRSVAAVFIDPKRLADWHRSDIAGAYFDLLAKFALFHEEDAGCIEGQVKACDASSRYAECPAGPDFVRVGDANMTVDPLSSQGVQLAIVSGIQAAIVINTLVKHSENGKDAIAFFQTRQLERVSQHAARAAAFYRERADMCDRPFWRQRAASTHPAVAPTVLETKELAPDCRIELSKLARIECMPTIQGNVIAPSLVLRHEALERAVAFLDGVELAPRLQQIRSGDTAEAVVHAWSKGTPIDTCWKVLHWLWHRRIVVPINEPASPCAV